MLVTCRHIHLYIYIIFPRTSSDNFMPSGPGRQKLKSCRPQMTGCKHRRRPTFVDGHWAWVGPHRSLFLYILSLYVASIITTYLFSLCFSLALSLIDSEAVVWCCPSRTWQWFYIHNRISDSSKRYTSSATRGTALGRDSMLLAPGLKMHYDFINMMYVSCDLVLS